MKKLKDNQILRATFLSIVTISIYYLNLFTPRYCDDWLYTFIFGTQTRINSLSDILQSQWNHYFYYNGRLIVHYILQLFDGLLDKGIFNIANTFMFMTFLFALCLVTSNEKKNYYKILSVAVLLVFVGIKSFKYNMLWLSGSLNYLWVATLLLLFHFFLEKESMPKWSMWLLIPFGLVCGWSNEAFIVGLGSAYFLYYLTHRQELNRHRICMLLAFCFGAVLLVFAPGSINRALNLAHGIHESLLMKFLYMHNVSLLYVLLIIIVYKAISNKNNFLQFVKKELVFLIAVLVSFCFVMATGEKTAHSRFGVEFFSLVLILRSINWNKINQQTVIITNIATLILLFFVVKACYDCSIHNNNELSQITNSKSTYIIVATERPDIPLWIWERYALDYFNPSFIDDEKYGTEKKYMNKYFGVDSITFLPKSFINDYKANPSDYRNFKTLKGLPFYAKILTDNQQNYFSAKIEYEDPVYSSLPQSLHPFCRKITGQPYSEDHITSQNINFNGQKFALVHRPWPKQDSRLKRITLE